MTDKTIFTNPTGQQSKTPGWFSWRHRTNEAHLAANVGRSRAESRVTKRAEAEARNAASQAKRYNCGHVHGVTGRFCEAFREASS